MPLALEAIGHQDSPSRSNLMRRWLLRLFQPEIEDLKRRLAFAEFEREAIRLERDNAIDRAEKAERQLKSEIKESRKRDEAFTDRILHILGVTPPAGRETLEEKPAEKSSNAAPELSTEDQEALWARAQEYLDQTKPDYSQADIKDTYQKMLKDPQHWLSNQ